MRRHRTRYWRRILVAAVFCSLATPALAEKRVALVIGNSSYKYVSGLANPVNDAEAIAEKLWIAGFEVIEAIDADLAQMQISITSFANRLAPGDEAIFYYAGHGVRVGQTNFLLPVSVHPATLDDLVKQSISAQSVVDAIDNAQVRLSIVILDSCRNNPFADLSEQQVAAIVDRSVTINGVAANAADPTSLAQSTREGLAELTSTSSEALIAFATAPGSVAYDGDGAHSPFTQALLQNIAVPGLEIGDVFRRVRADVRADGALGSRTNTISSG